MPSKIKYTQNQIINNLVFIKEKQPNGNDRIGMFQCFCGNMFEVMIRSIRSGNTKSCGCLARRQKGLTNHPLYSVLKTMKSRCNNKNRDGYARYGERGIKVCSLWSNNFLVFYNWAIENGYKKGLTIDRINNDGNYEPSNCRWVTNVINNRNRNNKLSYDIAQEIRNKKIILGRNITLKELAIEHGVSIAFIWSIVHNRVYI